MKIGTIAIINKGRICEALVGWVWRQPRSYHLISPRGEEITRQRNVVVEQVLGSWVFFIDSDCIPPQDTLAQLLSHDQGVVAGVVLERSGEFEVCAVKRFEPTVRWRLEELPPGGLMPVLSAGTGCLLIRRGVLETLGPPWFRCGQLVSDVITEDTDFCLRAAERGFPTFLDCGVRVGHEVSGILWPHGDGTPRIQWEGAPYMEPIAAQESVLV